MKASADAIMRSMGACWYMHMSAFRWGLTPKLMDRIMETPLEDIPRILLDTCYTFDKELLADPALWFGTNNPSNNPNTYGDTVMAFHNEVVVPFLLRMLELETSDDP